ncbi:hypothetical protein [Streptacidiphilus fuscans]|uniref:Uncharacterized protein n=1 Tax=Streptacidiphilus fuscans TaxID=2789292 RepID=A0A931B593_9ACTN|nr:hypothetical protein [Streptacidiphilus fuscans]MBF9069241.1 hypothetical protein [Streptacidiphilus fuscans]
MGTTTLEDVRALSTLIADAILDDDLMRGARTDATVSEVGRIVVGVDDREYVITVRPTPPTVADEGIPDDVPRYSEGDVLVDKGAPERRLEVLCVGEEAYFVRRLGAAPDGPDGDDTAEPTESAWAFATVEAATVRAGANL